MKKPKKSRALPFNQYEQAVRDHFFARSPFSRLQQDIEGRRIAADLVPHYEPSWRPLAAREMWRKP